MGPGGEANAFPVVSVRLSSLASVAAAVFSPIPMPSVRMSWPLRLIPVLALCWMGSGIVRGEDFSLETGEEDRSVSLFSSHQGGTLFFGFSGWSRPAAPAGLPVAPRGVLVSTRFDDPIMAGFGGPGEEGSLRLRYRLPTGGRTFLQSQSIFDTRNSKISGEGFRQVVGYGFRVIDRDSVKFDVVPGVFSEAYRDGPVSDEETLWSGNLNQNLSWVIAEGFAISQNFNTFVKQTEDEVFSAVMNLDLETLVSEKFSFRVSYEVLYDDSSSDEMERRDSRFMTSVGYRF